MLSSGCIIGPPDERKPLEMIAPRVFMDSALPTPFAYVATTTNGPAQTFSVEFVSEDLNEEVWGKLYLNFDDEGERLIGSGSVGPGSLDDERSPMTITWREARETAGCFAITMIISHRNNFDFDSQPIYRNKAAYVTWWVANGIAPEYLTFETCPPPTAQP